MKVFFAQHAWNTLQWDWELYWEDCNRYRDISPALMREKANLTCGPWLDEEHAQFYAEKMADELAIPSIILQCDTDEPGTAHWTRLVYPHFWNALSDKENTGLPIDVRD